MENQSGIEWAVESQGESLEELAQEGVAHALSLIEERYEKDSPGDPENLPFHDTEHTKSVVKRTSDILNTIREVDPELVSKKEAYLGILAAGFHDTVQDWQEKEVLANDGQKKVMRQRFVGKNEQKSSDELMQWLDSKGEIDISSEEKERMEQAILATVPGWDPENGTVLQPNLNPESPIIARAVALADLGVAGMTGAEAYTKEGNALFREESLDILEEIRKVGLENVSSEKQTVFRERMIQFLQSQAGFAEGRKKRLETEVGFFPEHVQGPVKNLFVHFDESIEAAKAMAVRSQDMSFSELAHEVGYGKK